MNFTVTKIPKLISPPITSILWVLQRMFAIFLKLKGDITGGKS